LEIQKEANISKFEVMQRKVIQIRFAEKCGSFNESSDFLFTENALWV